MRKKLICPLHFAHLLLEMAQNLAVESDSKGLRLVNAGELNTDVFHKIGN